MCWEKIDKHYSDRFNTNHILCDDIFEISFIIQLVSKYYPAFTKEKIASAIIRTKREIKIPRIRKDFWDSLSEKLFRDNNNLEDNLEDNLV